MKCIVCIACRIVLPSTGSKISGHLKYDAHKPGEDEAWIVPEFSANLATYLATQDLNDTQDLRPAPGSITPAYTWLEEPKEGWLCRICNDYAAPVADTLRCHITSKGGARRLKPDPCRDSDPSLQKVRYQDLIEKCFIQRFSGRNPLAVYFRVYPNADFLSSLPDPLKGVPTVKKSRASRKSISDKLSKAEGQGLREQIQSVNAQLEEQKKFNQTLLSEFHSLRELVLSGPYAHPTVPAPSQEIRNTSSFQVNNVLRLETPFPAISSPLGPGEEEQMRELFAFRKSRKSRANILDVSSRFYLAENI